MKVPDFSEPAGARQSRGRLRMPGQTLRAEKRCADTPYQEKDKPEANEQIESRAVPILGETDQAKTDGDEDAQYMPVPVACLKNEKN